MDAMDVDYLLGSWNFGVKYNKYYREATGKEVEATTPEKIQIAMRNTSRHKVNNTHVYWEDRGATGVRRVAMGSTEGEYPFIEQPSESKQNNVDADISPFQQNEVELAFNLSYIDAENVIGDFKRELHAKHRYWTEHRTKYVPYWTLFQASDYGKSRLIKEVAKDIPTLYLCLRPAASTGYPLRTEIIANFLEKTFFVQLRQERKSLTWDLQTRLWGPSFWTEVLRNIENWKQVTENDVLEIMSRLGRPLGYSYLESNKKNPRRLRNFIEHFKIKLLGGVDDLTRADITRASIAIVSLWRSRHNQHWHLTLSHHMRQHAMRQGKSIGQGQLGQSSEDFQRFIEE
ncbi:2918_t:CDS:2, partial [Funneliformis geosporum]